MSENRPCGEIRPTGRHQGTQAKRLSSYRQQILARLQRGPATNRELNEICLRYSARIKELRDAGHGIRIIHREQCTGKVVYALDAQDKAHRCFSQLEEYTTESGQRALRCAECRRFYGRLRSQ
jgi:hypothetical protein